MATSGIRSAYCNSCELRLTYGQVGLVILIPTSLMEYILVTVIYRH